MARKPKQPARTAGGSPIVYETVPIQAAGIPRYIDTRRAAAYVEDKDGYTHRVPVDSNGRVPMFAIVQHFLDTRSAEEKGRPRNIAIDLGKPAKTVHRIPPGGFTPEQIVATGWWDDPASSDIEGVDDTTSRWMVPWDSVGKSVKGKTSRIAVIGGPGETAALKRALTSNFTDAELADAVKDGGLVILAGNTGQKNLAGFYMRRSAGSDTAAIVARDLDEDTITHEFVHHLRQAQTPRSKRTGFATTPYDLDPSGHLIRKPGVSYESYTNLEEAATVAETTARTRKPDRACGYYQYVTDTDGRKGQASYQHDRELLTRGKTKSYPLKGKRAIDRVNESFLDTDISKLQRKGKGVRADRLLDKLNQGPAPAGPRREYLPGQWERVSKGFWTCTGTDGKFYRMFYQNWYDGTKEWFVYPGTETLTYHKGQGFSTRAQAEAYAVSLMQGGSR